MNKYEYLHVVQGDFGHGWEDVTAATNPREALNLLRDYRGNDPDHAYRKIFRREKRT